MKVTCKSLASPPKYRQCPCHALNDLTSPAFLTFSNWRGQPFQFICLHAHRVLALTHGLMARMQAPSAAVLGQQFAKFLDHDIKAEVAAVSKQVTASFN